MCNIVGRSLGGHSCYLFSRQHRQRTATTLRRFARELQDYNLHKLYDTSRYFSASLIYGLKFIAKTGDILFGCGFRHCYLLRSFYAKIANNNQSSDNSATLAPNDGASSQASSQPLEPTITYTTTLRKIFASINITFDGGVISIGSEHLRNGT